MSFGNATVRQTLGKDLSSDPIPWVRPSEWPSLTPISTSESKVTGLYAIWPDDSRNGVRFTFTTSGGGQYTVDWGDGTSQNVNNNTAVTKQYTYSSIAGSPTSYGYKIVTITVTPTTSPQTFTAINLRQVPTAAGTQVTYALNWLDIEIGSLGLTSLTVGGNNSTANFPLLKRLRWASKSTSYTSFTDLFYYLQSTEKFEIDCDFSNVTSCSAMFYGCTSLQYPSLFNTSNVTNATYMFGECYNLVTVPAYNWNKLSTMGYMFVNCRSLETVPLFNTGNVTSMDNTFTNCYNLRTIPPLDLPKATNLSNAFNSCRSLRNLTLQNLSNANNFTNMCLTSGVETVSLSASTTAANITFGGAFNQCINLRNITLFDTGTVANMNTMFNDCRQLGPNAPLGNTSNVTNFGGMFINCIKITNVDANQNVSKCTNFAQMFQGTGITDAPNWNLSNANNVNGMFSSCVGLATLPAYNLANVTSGLAQIIAGGQGITSATPLTNSNVTNARFTMTYSGCGISKDNLENIMTNMGSAGAGGQSFVVTGNPGADTALSKTATWTNNSNVMTMANTVGVTVGTQVTGANIANALAITVNSDNTITALSFIDNSTYIAFANVTTTNLAANTRYWVSNRVDVGSGNYTYQLSTSNGGSTISFTSGSANMLVNRIVTTVNTNANVILSAYPSGNGTSATATTRALNTNIVTFKGFSVTG